MTSFWRVPRRVSRKNRQISLKSKLVINGYICLYMVNDDSYGFISGYNLQTSTGYIWFSPMMIMVFMMVIKPSEKPPTTLWMFFGLRCTSGPHRWVGKEPVYRKCE